jgi:hypothetical protein
MFAAVPAHGASNCLGIGLVPPGNNNPLKLFADQVKCAWGFTAPDLSSAVSTDARGWPLDDAAILAWAGAVDMQGTYRLYFTTQDPGIDARTVTLSFLGAAPTPGNMAYDVATNTVGYDLALANAGAFRLIFRNTRGGVKNVKLMRPTVTGGTTPYDTSVTFTTQAKNLLGKFQVLRFMHVVNSLSDNMVSEWSERTKPDFAQQVGVYKVGGGNAGTAWEYLVRLCNEVGADMYANIPFLATDAYIDSLANLLKNTLDPQRKIYVEYSNELWDGLAAYDAHRNIDSANAEVARGGSPLNFDGETNTYYWAWRRAGKRGKEISDIFRRVFGDGAMMTRVRPLLMTQTGNGQATLSQNMEMMFDYYNNAAHVSDPKPPNYYFYGAGGAGYYDFDSTGTTIDNVWSSGLMDTNRYIRNLVLDIQQCATFGLKRIAYEGGFCYEGSNTALLNATWYDDRLTRAVIDHQDAWSRYGGDLFVNFSVNGWSPGDLRAAFFNNIDTLGTPKMRAVDSLNARPRAALTYGNAVPCSIDGDSTALRFYPLGDSWNSGPSRARPLDWFSYVVRIDQSGTYGVTVDATTTANGAIDILADGARIGAPGLVPGSQTTPKYTAYLEPGLHGIIVRVKSVESGRVSIDQVNVTVESLAANATGGIRALSAARMRAEIARGQVRVTVNGAREGVAILSICTMQGRIIASQTLDISAAGRASASLPVAGLSSGLYLARVGGATATVMCGR